jgi:hypothetical protein
VGNVVNRVFDSSGPEGKVRGTPQQIIDKYGQLARDAQLAGDRVSAENFQQHAEHYLRMLSEAQREQEARREEQERQNRERQADRDRDRARRQEQEAASGGHGGGSQGAQDPQNAPQPDLHNAPQPDIVETSSGESGLVETPETRSEEQPKRPRKPRQRKPAPTDTAEASDTPDAAE